MFISHELSPRSQSNHAVAVGSRAKEEEGTIKSHLHLGLKAPGKGREGADNPPFDFLLSIQ